MTIEEIRQRANKEMSADDYRSMSVSDIAQIRMDVKRLLKMLDSLHVQQEQPNEPLEIIFGRGEIAVDTVAENDDAPPREIMLRKLDSPILPVGSSTGGEGKSVDELNNIIVRMHFEKPESVKVLVRAANIVLGTFGEQSNEPLSVDELREMDGEPVWTITLGVNGFGRWELIQGDYGLRNNAFRCSNIDECDYSIDYSTYGKTWLAYRRKPVSTHASRTGGDISTVRSTASSREGRND